MQIHEIENLSFFDLKTRQAELIEAAKDVSVEELPERVDELAKRYVQARTDATMRDEKLADQAKTLEALRTGLDAATEKVAAAEQVSNDLLAKRATDQQTAEKEKAKASQVESDLNQRCKEVVGNFVREQQRSARLKNQADKFASAVTTIHKAAFDAINSQEIDDADKG